MTRTGGPTVTPLSVECLDITSTKRGFASPWSQRNVTSPEWAPHTIIGVPGEALSESELTPVGCDQETPESVERMKYTLRGTPPTRPGLYATKIVLSAWFTCM